MAHQINWTTDRPTEPGEYWVSLQPDRRRLGTAVEPATLLKARRRECVNFTGPLWNCIGSGSAAEELLAVQFDNDLFAKYYDLRAPAFDGALWAPRETPADPFQEVTT